MLDDLFYADNLRAAGDAALRPPPVPKQAAGFSAWKTTTAAPRGVVAGGAQSGGFFADTLAAFGQALGGTGTASAQGMFSTQTDAERQQSEQQAQKIRTEGLDFSSATGDNLRGFARFLAPDPETAHTAERLVFDLSRVMTKAVGYSVAGGGPLVGAVLTGADEGMTAADDLKQAGVDLGTRTKAGAVIGLATGAGVALPVAGNTLAQTAGLVATGGPLSFMAQQQAVRSILQAADYSKLAEQYDPLDPVGLAVSTLIPAGFGAWGLRAAKVRAAKEADAAAFKAGPVPSELTPVASAVREVSQEQIDAARVVFATEQRRAANPLGDDMRTADAHEAAMSKAIDQMAAGDRIKVLDVLNLERFTASRGLDDRISAVEDQRANLLGIAGNQLEPGQVRELNKQLIALESQRPNDSAGAVKALAKDLQASDQISFKQAMAQASKQIADQLAEHGAKVQHIKSQLDTHASAAQAAEAVSRIDRQLDDLKRQRKQQPGPPSSPLTLALAIRDAFSGKEPQTSEPPQAQGQAEPQPAPQTSAAKPEPHKPLTAAETRAIEQSLLSEGAKQTRYMGNKREFFQNVSSFFAKTAAPVLGKATTLFDMYAGGGTYGLTMALSGAMPKLKRVVINEVDPVRAERFRLAAERGGDIMQPWETDPKLVELATTLKGLINKSSSPAALATSVYRGESSSPKYLAMRDMAAKHGTLAPESNVALLALHDVFFSGRTASWDRLMKNASEDAERILTLTSAAKQRGIAVDVVSHDSLGPDAVSLVQKEGGNSAVLLDPPYHTTASGTYSAGGKSYDFASDDFLHANLASARAMADGNVVMYNNKATPMVEDQFSKTFGGSIKSHVWSRVNGQQEFFGVFDGTSKSGPSGVQVGEPPVGVSTGEASRDGGILAKPRADARGITEPAAVGNDGRARGQSTEQQTALDQHIASAIERVLAEQPGLMLRLDGMDAARPMAEVLAAIKAEADDMVLDAELMQVAAECALRMGA